MVFQHPAHLVLAQQILAAKLHIQLPSRVGTPIQIIAKDDDDEKVRAIRMPALLSIGFDKLAGPILLSRKAATVISVPAHTPPSVAFRISESAGFAYKSQSSLPQARDRQTASLGITLSCARENVACLIERLCAAFLYGPGLSKSGLWSGADRFTCARHDAALYSPTSNVKEVSSNGCTSFTNSPLCSDCIPSGS